MPPTTAPSKDPMIQPFFTKGLTNPYEGIVWEKRSSRIRNEKGETIFELNDAEIPSTWSQLATDIVVSKYFRKAGVPETGHEVSVKQVVHRIAHSIRTAGEEFGGYFSSIQEADTFENELAYILVNQRGAFNSPVWFNCGLWQEYRIEGSGGNWYFDFDKNEIVQAENNYIRPQMSACFIQSVEDDLMSMFDLIKAEARLFKYGSGTGSNFSNIRAAGEPLSSGGTSSGLLSFLKVFDAAAGAIKSGGTTRRAAKMVCIDMDHPDIETFINWKVSEEKKVAALVAAGYSSDFNGEAYQTVTAQNANNSVRVTDEFMKAVENDGTWDTKRRTDGKVASTYQARNLWDQLCQAAWKCADPGVQYDTTINEWHTCPNTDRINASNPCSEYMFLDDSSCNLASINLVKFIDDEGKFDIDAYRQAIRILFIAQDIIVDFASYPTKPIAQNSHDYRPLGLGYANIGTLLMYKGIPYDSAEACAVTGALTAILTGHAYTVSAEMAARKGTFNGYAMNRQPMLRVMRKHRDSVYQIDSNLCPEELLKAAQEDWEEAVRQGEMNGYRNAQATVIAPTGTIGLLMDCDTTSIEPDFALVKYKKLAGGGYFKIINQSVSAALRNLGYQENQIADILTYATGTQSLRNNSSINRESLKGKGISEQDLDRIEQQLSSAFELSQAFHASTISTESLKACGLAEDTFEKGNINFLEAIGFSNHDINEANRIICGTLSVEGAPHLKEEHLPVFDCANKCGNEGTRVISALGHIRIMAAAQPFISGAISKTVNVPFETSVEEIGEIYNQGWKLGLKAIALYRDGSKLSQPLNSTTDKKDSSKDKEVKEEIIIKEEVVSLASLSPAMPSRRRLPNERKAITHKFSVAGHEGYITVGMYEDGSPGEIFITMAKQGSVISGLMDAFATSISIALQYNVPIEVLVNKFTHMRFEPSGMTNNPNIRMAKSIVDYIFRWMGIKFLDRTAQEQIGYSGFNKLVEGEKSIEKEIATVTVSVDSIKEKAEARTEQVAVRPSTHLDIKAESKQESHREETIVKFKYDTHSDAPTCHVCGSMMTRNGSCYLCRDCGATSGCS